MKEFIYLSDETLKGTYLGIVDSSLSGIFITLIKLKNMMKTHYSWKIHSSEFIAMFKIHYSDKASLLMGNSLPWWIILFQWKYLSHHSDKIYRSDKNLFFWWKFITQMKIHQYDEMMKVHPSWHSWHSWFIALMNFHHWHSQFIALMNFHHFEEYEEKSLL